MKHITVAELQRVADVVPKEGCSSMSREQRLERWAELLEHEPKRELRALSGTEYQPAHIRRGIRAEGSPISVAFADARLRIEGLKDDSYGEARRFFELSDRQLHRIVCHCHHGPKIPASTAARYVRGAMAGSGILARLRRLATL